MQSNAKIVLLLFISLIHCQTYQGDQSAFTAAIAKAYADAQWLKVDSLVASIDLPTISNFEIRLSPLLSEDCRPSIQHAIDSCHQLGGGTVSLQEGVYFVKGPIHLKSKIRLHLHEGARLVFSDQFEDYLPLVKVRWEGTVCWNFSPLIYAYQANQISLTGLGEIDGNGKVWSIDWRKKQKPAKDRLRQMGNDTIPENERVFGNGFLDLDKDGLDDGFGDGTMYYLRPTLVEFYECEDIEIRDLTFRNAPFWTVHPVFSKNVTIANIRVFGGYLNDDGIDPDGSENVLIEDCYIETHDDAIAIKAGRDQDAWHRMGTRNIVIRNCILNSGVNSFAIGSEMSGGVENVFVENCTLKRGRHGLNFKTNLDRGGSVSQIFFRNITADTLTDALFIFRMDYHGYRGNNFPTDFSNFYASNISCNYAGKNALKLVGVAAAPLRRIFLSDIRAKNADLPLVREHVKDLILDNVKIGNALVKTDD